MFIGDRKKEKKDNIAYYKIVVNFIIFKKNQFILHKFIPILLMYLTILT